MLNVNVGLDHIHVFYSDRISVELSLAVNLFKGRQFEPQHINIRVEHIFYK